jgi:photosynthetic reaction center cytochrome c subunit
MGTERPKLFVSSVSQSKVLNAAALALMLTSAPVVAQPLPGGRTAEQVFKNIKVLQGTPADSLGQGMHLMSASLGVNCEFCHVEGNFVSDAIRQKQVARDMIEMTSGMNQRSFGGAHVVSCFTCHRGDAVPQNTPSLPVAAHLSAKNGTPRLPSVEQILVKYIAALGGEKALRSVSSRLMKWTQDIPTGPGGTTSVPAQVEEYRKVPTRVLNVSKTAGYTILSGFDGTEAWAQDPRGRVALLPALEQLRAKRSADFQEPLHLGREYARLTVVGIERVGVREAYLVVGYPQEDVSVRFFFDTESGLLLRKYTVTPTEAGDSPYQEDYSDYREAGSGVKYPYLIQMTPAGSRTELTTHSTIRVQQIQENVVIDDAKFGKPESRLPTVAR